ncbi:MAG: type II toxin-antitoxin system RelE/ParE family toxin [Burkholderiales bacterium]|jgi:addiction module RelE/StbE family toxin|nr:type II toxin-antitoxin system RelE/ParE family toxin [Burkholderiales bacterium]
MQVKWLRNAAKNLNDATEYLVDENPKVAREFFVHIIESVNKLAQFPQLGRSGRVAGTRELVIVGYPYIVPYRIKDGNVEILRVFHTSRIWPIRF